MIKVNNKSTTMTPTMTMAMVNDACILKRTIDDIKFNDPDPHSFINIGVKKTIVETRNIKINKKNITINNSSMINPFFTGIDGGSVISLPRKTLYQNYKYVYIMCLKNNILNNENNGNNENNDNRIADVECIMNIFNRIIDKTLFASVCNKFMLIKTNTVFLRNYALKKKANIIENSILETYFKKNDGSNYDIDEIVIPMYELNETKTRMYIKMCCGNLSLDNLNNMMSLASHYNKNYSTGPIETQMMEAIAAFDISLYWTNPKHCNFNMDEIFNKRTLSYNGHRLDQIRYATLRGAKTLNNLLTNLDINDNMKNRKNINVDHDINYLDNIQDKHYEKSENMNMRQVLCDSKNRTFYATIDDGNVSFTKDDLANIFDKITEEKYRFHLLNSLLVSKELCHYVINNKRILQRNVDLFEKYLPLYAYLFGYAWVTFYLEESIFATNSTKKHRYVYDIDTANELPMFPFSMENVHNNPYVSLLLNHELIDTATNCMSGDSLENYKKYYGLCSKEEALKRFNIFTSGKHDINIFKNINSKIFSYSGSCIPACLQRRNPLIDICTSDDMTYDDIYATYFAHYYGDADIDVMCGTSTIADFMLHGTIFLETVCKNINCTRADINITPNKKMAVIISKHFFKECIDDLNGELGCNYNVEQLCKIFDHNLSADNDNYNNLPDNIINYFYVDYVQEKEESIKKWKSLQQINNVEFDKDLMSSYNIIAESKDMIVKLVNYDMTEDTMYKKDSEIYYYINDFRDDDHKVAADKNYLVFKFSESIKYKIESHKLKRTIELFKVDVNDPFATVARFHMPCVRAYLQGDTFYMLPSFITAMMTSINIDYKYFAGSRDPIEIINKYQTRNYSIILNASEKKSTVKYNKNIDNSNGMYKVENDNKYFGTKIFNDKIYKPGVYKLGLPKEIYKISNHKYIKSMDELKKVYRKHCENYGYNFDELPIDILKNTCICKTGNVSPVKMWITRAYYDFVNN